LGSPDCESVTHETATTWTSGQPSGRQFLSEILSVYEFTLSSRTARQTCDAKVTGQDPVETTCEGARLIAHPLRLYETPNLQLIQAGIGSKMPAANVVRCFNVLGFFDAAFLKTSE
jgi:hypothetical protein